MIYPYITFEVNQMLQYEIVKILNLCNFFCIICHSITKNIQATNLKNCKVINKYQITCIFEYLLCR